MKAVQIINTGVANIRSLQASFDRLKFPWELTEDGNMIASAAFVVLPGVGAFSAAIDRLAELGLVESIRDRIHADRPTLAICLGLQLLCQSSAESPGVEGLGIVEAEVGRFSPTVQVPQLGWNDVQPRSAGPVTRGQAYFANSYRLTDAPAGWGWAETRYGGPFVSSLWRGRTLACQFHPELSGPWGQSVISNWLEDRQC